jgi:hypothetical protein
MVPGLLLENKSIDNDLQKIFPQYLYATFK